MRESFIFYASFYDSIKELDDATQLKVYQAVMEFALNGNEIELSGIPKAIFTLIKPQILANNKRFENGCKGGRPKKTSGFENKKPVVLKNEENKKPNDNVNENDNVNVNENENIIIDAFDEKIQKCFSLYKENCKDLIPLSLERRSRDVIKLINEVLFQLDNDVGQFKSLCEKANRLRTIADNKIDFKMMLRNCIGILNGKYDDTSPLAGLVFRGDS